MDAAFATQVFRQLFARPARHCLRLHPQRAPSLQRSYAVYRDRKDYADGGSRWQQRIDAFPRDMTKQLREYPKLTAHELRNRTNRPRRVKMLTRDFIEGSAFGTVS